MTISEYKLKKDFRAPKVNIKPGEFQSYFTFSKGQTLIGYVNKDTGEDLVITENRYAVPLKSLEFVRDIEIDGEPVDFKEEAEKSVEEIAKDIVKGAKKEKVEIPAEYREQMDKIKNTNLVSNIVNKSRNSVQGAVIGGVVGLIIAAISGKSKFGGFILGGVAGGLIGNAVTQDVKKDNKPKPEAATDSKPAADINIKKEDQNGSK